MRLRAFLRNVCAVLACFDDVGTGFCKRPSVQHSSHVEGGSRDKTPNSPCCLLYISIPKRLPPLRSPSPGPVVHRLFLRSNFPLLPASMPMLHGSQLFPPRPSVPPNLQLRAASPSAVARWTHPALPKHYPAPPSSETNASWSRMMYPSRNQRNEHDFGVFRIQGNPIRKKIEVRDREKGGGRC